MQLYEFFAILDCVQKNALAVENTVAVFILTLMAWHRVLLKIQKMAYWCSNQFFLKNVWLWSAILCEAASIANNLWNVIFLLTILRNEMFETKLTIALGMYLNKMSHCVMNL